MIFSQQPVRRITEAEQLDIQATLRKLTLAVNQRDGAAMKALTAPNLDVRGEGRFFEQAGMSRYTERRGEDLSRVQLATLAREVRLLSEDVAMVDGFFRTSGWPGRDYAGTVNAILLRREGKWLTSKVRFAPIVNDGTYHEVKPNPGSASGWIDLLKDSALTSFTGINGGTVPECWSLQEGVLKLTPGGAVRGGMRTKETFSSFELEFEWKVPPKGNSGIKYRIFFLGAGGATGYEYQLVDDAGDRGAIASALERSGGLYNQIAPAKQVANPVGEFNRSKIVVRGRHGEHWLNGEKVVGYEAESAAMESPIVLTYHGTEVEYRNLRIRRISAE